MGGQNEHSKTMLNLNRGWKHTSYYMMIGACAWFCCVAKIARQTMILVLFGNDSETPTSRGPSGVDATSELGPSPVSSTVFKFEVVFSRNTVVDNHITVLIEWWWCLVTCSRPQVVLERSCGCGWVAVGVGGLINGTHKCYCLDCTT